MKKLYSIGEMSKLVNVSVQTLRHYEKIKLFRPSYIDPNTNYRYYSDSQFHYLDIIKSLKFIGLPLQKIKEAQQLNPEEFLQFLEQQDQEIMTKIKQLEEVRLSLQLSKRQLQEQLAIPWLTEVYEKEMEEERILMIKSENATPQFIEDYYFTKLFRTLEAENIMQNSRYGCIYTLGQYQSVDEIHYEQIYVPVLTDRAIESMDKELQLHSIPTGRYLCIAYEANIESLISLYTEFYNKLYSYIKQNACSVEPLVYEVVMPSNYSPEQEEKFIIELKVRYSS